MTSRRVRVLPMRPRDIDEEHRVSTPLELLFDLSFVVAVSQAADQLNAALGAGHFHTAVLSYLLVFFAIWWAWVNFTWFASAYDVDDLLYRLFTFVQIIGVLILAAGVESAFTAGNFTVMTIGYVVMRIAMVAQWLRAAAGDPAARPAALRYAACISILQVGWVLRLLLPQPEALWVFFVLAVGEMLVPVLRRAGGARGGTPWHPGHIAERYGLFTLIVLGECIAAVTVALHGASPSHGVSAGLVAVIAGAVLIVFSIWWWYFENPAEEGLRMSRQLVFVWGYGHYVVLGSLGALGAGLQLAAAGSHGALSTMEATTAGLAVAVPVAAYLVVTGVLQARLGSQWSGRVPVVCGASVVLLGLGGSASGLGIGLATLLMGVMVAALVVWDELRRDRAPLLRAQGLAERPRRRRRRVAPRVPTVTPRITGCRRTPPSRIVAPPRRGRAGPDVRRDPAAVGRAAGRHGGTTFLAQRRGRGSGTPPRRARRRPRRQARGAAEPGRTERHAAARAAERSGTGTGRGGGAASQRRSPGTARERPVGPGQRARAGPPAPGPAYAARAPGRARRPR